MKEFALKLLDEGGLFLIHLTLAILVLVLGMKLVTWLSTHPTPLQKRIAPKIDPNTRSYVGNASMLLGRLLVLVLAALVLGISRSVLITLFGSAAVTVGLALQGSLTNLAGGMMLMFFRPFRIGDYITAGGNEGTVVRLTAFYTTIRTIDNRLVILPNGALTNDTLINCTAEEKRMVQVPVSASYSSDIEKVERVLLETAIGHPSVLLDPEPMVIMTGHGASSVNYELRAWVPTPKYIIARSELFACVKAAFDRENIEIPFPQLDIHQK